MKKILQPSLILMVLLYTTVVASHAHALGGICSGGACSSGSAKGLDATRKKLWKQYHTAVKKNLESAGTTDEEQAAALVRDGNLTSEHRKALSEWVSKKHPQLKKGSAPHNAKVDEELEKDDQRGPDEL